MGFVDGLEEARPESGIEGHFGLHGVGENNTVETVLFEVDVVLAKDVLQLGLDLPIWRRGVDGMNCLGSVLLGDGEHQGNVADGRKLHTSHL